MDEANQLKLSFNDNDEDDGQVQVNVQIQLFINGDLKYFAQVLDRDGMSTSWCMYRNRSIQKIRKG